LFGEAWPRGIVHENKKKKVQKPPKPKHDIE
jgi:hypothetical protein